jgi:hypothetical protein
MDTTVRRYTAPAQPPRLAMVTPSARGSAGVVCLHTPEHGARMRLVTFDWGRVVMSRRSR